MFSGFQSVRAESKEGTSDAPMSSQSPAQSGVQKTENGGNQVKTDSTSSKNGYQTRHPYWWMVKPCYIYKEEYKDCKSIKERFNQYFIYGEMQECEHWNEDYKNCRLWENSQDEKALAKLIESERLRVRTRLRNHYLNDVWENREKPPENWNCELPEHITKGYEHSFLKAMRDELKKLEEDAEAAPAQLEKRRPAETLCRIM